MSSFVLKKSPLGGINSDSSEFNIPSSAVRYRLNMRAGSGGNMSVGELQNISGNSEITFELPGESSSKCIGSYVSEKIAKAYIFIYNDAGYHGIYEFDYLANTVVPVLISKTDSLGVDVLNFSLDYRINHINLADGEAYDDDGVNQELLLYWTDGLNAPRKINIERCKAGFYSGLITDETISAIQARPTTPIYGSIISDTATKINNIKGKLFQFKYRYVYLDGEASAWSSVSRLFEAANENFYSVTDLTTNNAIILTLLYSNQLDCSKIEIAGRITSDTNKDFFLIDTVDNDVLGSELNYTFRNNGQYSAIDINESNLDQDFVPKIAETQELVNGNVIVYGNIVDGFDPVEVDMEVESGYALRSGAPISGSVSMTNTYVRYDHSSDTNDYRITLSGVPSLGDVFTVTFVSSGGVSTVKATYTADADDTITDVLNNIFAQMHVDGSGIFDERIESSTSTGGTIRYEVDRTSEGGPNQIIVSAQGATLGRYSYKELKQDAWYQYGLVYYDKFGRHGSVMTSDACKVETNPSPDAWFIQGYAANATLTINHLPPDWAETYQVVRTKNLTYQRWLYWASKAVRPTVTGGNPYVDFDIVTLSEVYNKIETSSVLSYSFTKGDRLRVRDNLTTINTDSTETTANDIDFEILSYEVKTDTSGNVTNVFLRIADPGALVINTTDVYLFEVYTPKSLFSQENLNVFYEFGEKYNIINGEGFQKIHEGKSQNQSDIDGTPAIIELMYEGDSYLKNRSIPTNSNPSDRLTNPVSVEVVVEEPHFSDYYESAVYDEGYANVIDANAKEIKRPTTIYYSQTFVPQSNVNGLSRFYPLNFEEYDRNKGAIKKLALRDNYLITYQQLQTGFIPVYRSIIEDLSSSGQVGLSQRLLQNTATYYQYDHCGIGEATSSFARFENNFYHVNPNNGTVFRLSAGGMEPISTTYGMNYYFSQKLKNYIGLDKVIGYVDTDKSEYIITFEGIGEVTSEETIAFNEGTKMFSSFYSYIADEGFTAGNELFTLKNGGLWKHETNSLYNNFYGTQYNSEVEPVWNDNPLLTKSYVSLALQTNGEWSATITTELGQVSNLQVEDFYVEDLGGGVIMKDREGVRYASFLRDENSEGGILDGDKLKGVWLRAKLTNTSSDAVYLFTADVKASVSPQGIR